MKSYIEFDRFKKCMSVGLQLSAENEWWYMLIENIRITSSIVVVWRNSIP